MHAQCASHNNLHLWPLITLNSVYTCSPAGWPDHWKIASYGPVGAPPTLTNSGLCSSASLLHELLILSQSWAFNRDTVAPVSNIKSTGYKLTKPLIWYAAVGFTVNKLIMLLAKLVFSFHAWPTAWKDSSFSMVGCYDKHILWRNAPPSYICDILLVGFCSVGLGIDLLISVSGILVGPAVMLPVFSTVVWLSLECSGLSV